MAISQNQIVDYLNKKVGYGVAKTDLYTAKQPYNESIASPLLVPGATVLQQDYAIPNVSSAPSANTVLNGSTIVSVYNTSTSAVVQGTALSEFAPDNHQQSRQPQQQSQPLAWRYRSPLL